MRAPAGGVALITSTRNRHVVAAARLKKRGLREQDGRFLVEGAQAAAEALAAGIVEAVFHTAELGGRAPAVVADAVGSGVPVSEVSPSVMARLTSTVTPQGLVAVARFVDVPLAEASFQGLVPILCSVRDPGNAGTILRSADASGAAAVVFTDASVDVYNSKTVRASAGSLFHLPVVRDVSPPDVVLAARAAGAQVLAAASDGEASAYDVDLTAPTALLLGNEAWGLPAEVRALADRSVRIPIRGRAESLNLAAAAAVLMFESARQRASRGSGLAGLISAAGHDLRLPLTALKGFSATLIDRWDRFDEPARRELVQGMLLDTERVLAMVTMVVDAARMEEGRLHLMPERVDLAEIAGWVAAMFERTPDYPPVSRRGSGEALADPDRVRSILLALCDGAMWWGHAGPISIEVRTSGETVTMDVHRAGDGPTPEELEAMFDAGAPGSNVGLHVARRIAEAHGGTLVAEGGDGIRFRLTLPAAG